LIFSIIFEKRTQVNIQNNIQPKNIDQKERIHSDITEKSMSLLSEIIQRSTRNSAIAVQSLNRLSPSNTHISLLGAHIDLKSDNTATVSVAEIIAQNNKHTMKGISSHKKPSVKNIILEIANTDINNQNIDKEKTGIEFLSNSL
jgi:hypothetical protein